MRQRVKGLWIVLTGLWIDACHLAAVILAVMTLTGCAAGRGPVVPVPPVVAATAECPAPRVPALPQFDPALPFDAPENVEVMLARDDITRRYLNGLRAAVRCYEAQKHVE